MYKERKRREEKKEKKKRERNIERGERERERAKQYIIKNETCTYMRLLRSIV